MPTPSEMRLDVADAINEHGQRTRLRFYTGSYTGSYDDAETKISSGTTLWVNGLSFPAGQASTDAALLAQGLIVKDDRTLYLHGSVETNVRMEVMLGSPNGSIYQVLGDLGVREHGVSGTTVFNEVFIRHLPNGSFIGV